MLGDWVPLIQGVTAKACPLTYVYSWRMVENCNCSASFTTGLFNWFNVAHSRDITSSQKCDFCLSLVLSVSTCLSATTLCMSYVTHNSQLFLLLYFWLVCHMYHVYISTWEIHIYAINWPYLNSLLLIMVFWHPLNVCMWEIRLISSHSHIGFHNLSMQCNRSRTTPWYIIFAIFFFTYIVASDNPTLVGFGVVYTVTSLITAEIESP